MADADENTNGEVVTPPVTPTQTPVAPVKEDVTNTGKDDEKYVPLARFQEVNNAAKEAKDAAAAATAELTRIKEALGGPPAEEPFLDADAKKALDAYMTDNGYVKKDDLNKVTAQEQATRDLAEIKTAHKLSDEDFEKVRAQAVKMGAANKDGLEAAYTTLFMDKIVEDKVKEALAGQKPTAPSTTTTGEVTTTPKATPIQALRERIKAANKPA